MDYLPSSGEQDWLIDSVAGLIFRQGHASFVAAPMLEPTNRYFPDPWEASARGVRTLCRRLLTYVGLGDLKVHVELYAIPTK